MVEGKGAGSGRVIEEGVEEWDRNEEEKSYEVHCSCHYTQTFRTAHRRGRKRRKGEEVEEEKEENSFEYA